MYESSQSQLDSQTDFFKDLSQVEDPDMGKKNTSYLVIGGLPKGIKEGVQNEFYGNILVPGMIQASHFHTMLSDTFSKLTSMEGAKDKNEAEMKISSLLLTRFKDREDETWVKLSGSVKKNLLENRSWTYSEFENWVERRKPKPNTSQKDASFRMEDEGCKSTSKIVASFQIGEKGQAFFLSDKDITEDLDDNTPAPAALLKILPQLIDSNSNLREENATIRKENSNLREELKQVKKDLVTAKDDLFTANTDLISQATNTKEVGKTLEPLIEMIGKLNTQVTELATSTSRMYAEKPKCRSLLELLENFSKIYFFCSKRIQDELLKRGVTGPILDGLQEYKRIIFINPSTDGFQGFLSSIPDEAKAKQEGYAILMYEPNKSTGVHEYDKLQASSSLQLAKVAMKQIKKSFANTTIISLPANDSKQDNHFSIVLEEGLKKDFSDSSLILLNLEPANVSLCPLTFSTFKAIGDTLPDTILTQIPKCGICTLLCPPTGCLNLREPPKEENESIEIVEEISNKQSGNDKPHNNQEEDFNFVKPSFSQFSQFSLQKKPRQENYKKKSLCVFCGMLSENHNPPNKLCSFSKSITCNICLPSVQHHHEQAHTVQKPWARTVMCRRWGADFRFVTNIDQYLQN